MDTLDEYRKDIDAIDEQLLQLFAKRAEVSQKIGQTKRHAKLPLIDTKRWETLVDNRLAHAESLGLDGGFVADIWARLHDYSLDLQSGKINTSRNQRS